MPPLHWQIHNGKAELLLKRCILMRFGAKVRINCLVSTAASQKAPERSEGQAFCFLFCFFNLFTSPQHKCTTTRTQMGGLALSLTDLIWSE